MQMRAPVRQNAPAIWMPVCTAGLLWVKIQIDTRMMWMPVCTAGLLWVKIQIDTRMMVMSKLSLDYAFISA